MRGDNMRKLATAAFSFSAAIFMSRYLIPYNLLPLIGAVVAVVALTGLFFHGYRRIRIMTAFFALAVGLLWSWAYTTLFISPSWELSDNITTVRAVITGYPSERTRGYRVDAIIKRNGKPDIGARLYYYAETTLEPGYTVELTARFRRTDGINDGERFDALSSRGAFLSAYVSGDIKVTNTHRGLRYFPLRLANSIALQADRMFPDDISPLMQALIVGKQDELNRDAALTAALSAAGIIHVVAISGSHVAFLMGFIGLVIKNKRRLAYIGIPVLVFFMALTGFVPSVNRAVIMQIFLICAPVFKRESDNITSLSAALLVILAANPYACASAGLQLSFAATLGILLFTSRINAGISDYMRGTRVYKKKWLKTIIVFVTTNLATTVGASIFTIPLSVAHFGYVSLISPLTNLLTLWAVSVAFPLGLAACILGVIFNPLGLLLAFPATVAVRYIIFIAQTLASVPYSVIYKSNVQFIFWLAYIYIIFITLPLMRARARQYIYPACIAIILLVALILFSPLTPGAGDTSCTVLDIGQGLSVVLASGRHTVVVDCGSSSGENAGAIAHEFLLGEGRAVIDVMILTHFHEDHANGVEFLMSRVDVSTLVIPDPEDSYLAEDIIGLARKRGTDIIYVTETYQATLGDMNLTIYPPLGFGDENERGLTILAEGNLSVLITGDMNASVERSLLRYAELPKIDLLVVGHHGSKYSTSTELLDAVSPNIAVISVGHNTYGHPAEDTIWRLMQYGARIYRTDISGNVTVGGR